MIIMNRIKAKLYALFFWQTRIGEVLNKIYDLTIFYKYAFTNKTIKSKESYHAYLTKQYHIIEKGLALPNPKENFGIPKIKLLITKAEDYTLRYGEDILINNIKDALDSYLLKNKNLKIVDLNFYNLVTSFINSKKNEEKGGVKKVTYNEIKKSIAIDFESFIKSRSSVRNFATSDIIDEDVLKAVDLARFTPSVCNRQSWKVHYIKDLALMQRLLKLQNGNNGFADSINKLLIVTADTKNFTQLESNQVFVDGGMFAMSLLLALHAQEVASCCLNTCLPYVDEKKIKNISNIPNSERLIMFIGIGKYKTSFEVAISNRIGIKQIIS